MDEKLQKHLWDVLDRIKRLEDALTPISSYAEFSGNYIIIAATERHIEVIGSAVKEAISIKHDIEITDSKKIIGMRNIIAHGYNTVEPPVLWATWKKSIPILKKEIEKLLAQ